MEHTHEVGDTPYYSDCPACRIEQAAPALLDDCKAVRQCLAAIDDNGNITSGCVYQKLVADIALAENGETMSYHVCSGYCPKCGSVVEHDDETEITRCTHCDWREEPNRS